MTDHELLIRIEERLKALKDGDEGDVPKILSHLIMLNGWRVNHEGRISRVEGKVKVILLVLGGVLGGGGAFVVLLKLALAG